MAKQKDKKDSFRKFVEMATESICHHFDKLRNMGLITSRPNNDELHSHIVYRWGNGGHADVIYRRAQSFFNNW